MNNDKSVMSKVGMVMQKVLKKIKSGQIAPIYLLYGTERFFIDHVKQAIIEQLLTREEMDFNYSIFDMNELPVDSAIDEAETLPFIGDKRITIIKDPLFLTASKDKSKIEHDIERFSKYIDNPSVQTVLIILAPYEKLDERKKIVKLLKKQSEIVHAEAMNQQLVADWIDHRLLEMEFSMTSSAKELLIELVGLNIMMLDNELTKLSLASLDKSEITEDLVLELVPRTLEHNIFSLINNVVKRNLSEALKIFYDLLEQKEEPIKIVSLLARQFRMIYQVSELSKKGYGQNQIASTLKIKPFQVKLAKQQGRYFDERELLNILNELADCDYMMKTGQMEKCLVLEMFLMKLHKEKKKEAVYK